ncbi:MAG: enoyl-CoA hydratase/isomerase family protein [Clostridia bacterium]|nr:enoyl-CoA hydratase/isomerase family protein [Clostridia bacterium]
MNTEKKYENYLLEVKDNVAIFTINREKKLNAVSESCFKELYEFLCEADDDPDIRVIIFTGAGRKSFISGADISGFSSSGTPGALKTRWADRAANKLEMCAKPVIAAINGYAFGGGFELALACDIRIVSENARFGLPEPKLGLIPGLGGTQRLARVIGMGRTKEVVLAGREITGAEAVDIGLAMKCVPLDDLMDEAMAVAKKLMTRAPLALAVAKKLIHHSMSTNIDAGLYLEAMGFSLLMVTEDTKEGTAAFREKRKPNFTGK